MKYRSSYDTSYTILAIIAKHMEYAQYDLHSTTKKDYRTVLRHLKHLKQQNLIHLARTEPASKGGKDRNIYALTFQGLITLLKHPSIWKQSDTMDDIAGKYSALLPLVFGKWELYAESGFKEQVVTRLRSVITDPTLLDPLRQDGGSVTTRISPDYITERVLTAFPESDVFYQLLTISARDPDLRRFFDQHMEKLEKRYTLHLETIHDWMATWETIKTE